MFCNKATCGGGFQEEDISQVNCGLSEEQEENANHLFLHRKVAHRIQVRCFRWWGIHYVLPICCWDSLQQHVNTFFEKEVNNGWSLVWFAVVWTLWLYRNEKVFKDKEPEINRMFDTIQVQSFLRQKFRANKLTYSLFD